MRRDRNWSARRWVLLVALTLLLSVTSCDQGAEPTSVLGVSEVPSATATETAPATLPPTATPEVSSTLEPSNTPRPSPTSRPTATPRPSPTPVGAYGDPGNGWSIQFPTDWEIVEMGEGFPTIRVTDPRSEILVLAGWDFSSSEDSLDDVAEMLIDALTAEWEEAGEVVADDVQLQDGTPARRLTVVGGGRPPMQIQLVLAERGARLYIVVIAAEPSAFQSRGRTIDAVVRSLTLTSLHLYDVDRSTALVLEGSEPYDLDPATTEDGPASYVGLLFRGLVMLDTDLQVVPDLAERWEISEDGRIYTFYLRPEAVFFDGKAVTAADFQYAWERAADPELGSTKASTYLGDIVGVREKLAGEADQISGLAVVDDHTLQVTIDEPKVYFLAKLTWPVAFVVDRENVEVGEADDWWRAPNGVGPFRIERWDEDVIVFVRNDTFYGPAPKLEHVVYLLEAGPSILLYESGEIDIAGVGPDLADRVEDPTDPLNRDLHTVSDLCTFGVNLDASRPPFDDPLVRQAFSYAVDRQKILDVVLKGALQPAAGPLPPGMPGYSPELDGYHFDPDLARDLIGQSSYGEPANLPPLTLTTSGYTNPDATEESLVETWGEVFGIEIEIELLEPFGYEHQVRDHHGQMFMLGWCADYPDPENFLDVLYHSHSGENLGRYVNVQVDALLEQARTERDAQARLALYHQVEQQIVDDAASIWLWHTISRSLIKPYVHGYVVLPMSVPQLQNVYLDPR